MRNQWHKILIRTDTMTTHILNGDSLREQFPTAISGEIIVAKECLVDGNVSGESLEDLYKNRIAFLQQAYQSPIKKYHDKVIVEFEKIQALGPEAEVNLWFEDDLFCQVNMWFVAFLLKNYTQVSEVFLIRPTADLRYGFGGMSQEDLRAAYGNKEALSSEHIEVFATLWTHYQANELASMQSLAQKHASMLPFLPAAVQAHLDRFPIGDSRLERSLKAIIAEVGQEFVPVFRAFHERESIYGFGDLQVKRLFDELIAST